MPLFLLTNWKAILAGAGALALLLSLGWMTHSRNEWRATAKESVAALTLTGERLKVASETAKASAIANVVAVKEKQETITKDIINDYESKLAASATASERLRDRAEAYSRSTSGANLSAAREGACRAYAGTNCEAIPTLLTEAQKNTDQLTSLQAWQREQETLIY